MLKEASQATFSSVMHSLLQRERVQELDELKAFYKTQVPKLRPKGGSRTGAAAACTASFSSYVTERFQAELAAARDGYTVVGAPPTAPAKGDCVTIEHTESAKTRTLTFDGQLWRCSCGRDVQWGCPCAHVIALLSATAAGPFRPAYFHARWRLLTAPPVQVAACAWRVSVQRAAGVLCAAVSLCDGAAELAADVVCLCAVVRAHGCGRIARRGGGGGRVRRGPGGRRSAARPR